MRNLKILHAKKCGISQQGIKGLNLTELHVDHNYNITDYHSCGI